MLKTGSGRKLTNWTDDGAEERRSSEEAHCQSSLGSREHVCDDTTGIRQWRRAKRTGKKPQDEQGLDVLGACSTGVESSKGHICAEQEVLSTKQFYRLLASFAF
jgi:hypothetical protein